MRRRLTWFYVMFYLCSFALVVAQKWFLHETWILLLTNSSLWIPQIVKSYRERSRKGPSMQLAVGLLFIQCFLPLYLKMCPNNFLELQTDQTAGLAMLGVMVA
jgi:hypothetical protein